VVKMPARYEHRAKTDRSRGMGPGLRRDDTEIRATRVP
jgi:hypothetical protein